jgi:TPR repeat protein
MDAALGGNRHAAVKLGDMYRDGRGTARKNLEEAYVWYCVAMMEGDPGALGIVNEMDGKGLLNFRSVSPATSRRARERALHIYEASLDIRSAD